MLLLLQLSPNELPSLLASAGQQALAAVARASDGRSSPTILTEAVLQHCNVSTAEELMR